MASVQEGMAIILDEDETNALADTLLFFAQHCHDPHRDNVVWALRDLYDSFDIPL